MGAPEPVVLCAYSPHWPAAFEAEARVLRAAFRPATGAARVHLHAVETGRSFWRDHLTFRDALRNDGRRFAEYLELKRGLALRFGADREAYTDAKAPFIRRILRELRPH